MVPAGRSLQRDHIYGTTWGIARQFPRGGFEMHVISHRAGRTRHFSAIYLVLSKEVP